MKYLRSRFFTLAVVAVMISMVAAAPRGKPPPPSTPKGTPHTTAATTARTTQAPTILKTSSTRSPTATGTAHSSAVSSPVVIHSTGSPPTPTSSSTPTGLKTSSSQASSAGTTLPSSVASTLGVLTSSTIGTSSAIGAPSSIASSLASSAIGSNSPISSASPTSSGQSPSATPCKRGEDGDNCSRPGSPEPPELEDDDADEDTDPTEAAYSTTGTDTDGVETDNPEDYNPEDLEAAQKAFDENAKTKRDLFKRLPTAIRAILSASKPFLPYVKGYFAQDASKQVIFYLKKSKQGDFTFVKGTNAKKPPGVGEMNVEHVLEIQRVKTLFSRPDVPAGVDKTAWETMKTSVDDSEDSDTNPTKKSLGGVLNAVANLRGFQARPNLLKGKLCTFIDKTNSGAPTTSTGPNWKETWARSEAFAAAKYLKATSKQYTASAKAISDVVLTATKDEKLAAWVTAQLADLHSKDLKAITDVVNKPVGQAGEVFKTEDMPKVPKV